MKILQTRAAAEPILLVTTCHNMNLLAVVTRSLVAVYRSTTLAVVTTLPLALRGDTDTRTYVDSAVCACWSPSGRLLAVGLACGELYLLDVEGGDLVRRFVPRGLTVSKDSGSGERWDNSADKKEIERPGDSAADPLRQPPFLSVSISGALIACAWAAAPPHEPLPTTNYDPKHGAHSDPSDCSSPSDNVVSGEAEGSPPTGSADTCDHVGAGGFSAASLCLAPCAAATSPVLEEAEQSRAPVLVLLDACGGLCLLPGGLQEVCVVSIAAQLPCALDPRSVRVECFTIAESHTASFVLFPRESDNDDNAQRVRMDLRACIAAAASREAVALCCVAERCRVAAAARVHAQREWAVTLRRARALLCVDARGDSFAALRDALVESLARQEHNTVSFAALDSAALSAAAADILRAFARIALRLTGAGQRSHDAALHQALFARKGGQQHSLAEAIAAVRRRADLFLRRARRDGLRERELLLWAVQRAQPGAAVVAASRHPSLLRTAHRALRPAAGLKSKNEEENDKEEEADAAADEALARVLDECLFHSRETASWAAVRVSVDSYARRGVSASLDAAIAGGAAAVRWSGAVDSDGRRAVLWEREGGLAVALVGEDGQIAEREDDEDGGLAVLEIKGLAARHVRASVSRARGFGVFYAKERFVVIDFYDS